MQLPASSSPPTRPGLSQLVHQARHKQAPCQSSTRAPLILEDCQEFCTGLAGTGSPAAKPPTSNNSPGPDLQTSAMAPHQNSRFIKVISGRNSLPIVRARTQTLSGAAAYRHCDRGGPQAGAQQSMLSCPHPEVGSCVQKVPQSAVGPAFKLSLVSYAHWGAPAEKPLLPSPAT